MNELKVTVHTTYTYETSDGREFDDEREAKVWQEQLSVLDNICMLDRDHKPTKEFDCICYLHAETKEQVDAFNAMQEYLEYQERLNGVGYYRYDRIADRYINIESEIKELQYIIGSLRKGDDE